MQLRELEGRVDSRKRSDAKDLVHGKRFDRSGVIREEVGGIAGLELRNWHANRYRRLYFSTVNVVQAIDSWVHTGEESSGRQRREVAHICNARIGSNGNMAELVCQNTWRGHTSSTTNFVVSSSVGAVIDSEGGDFG